MGQYHKPVCIERAEGFHPHKLGAGLKAGEMLYGGSGVPQALAGLVCQRSGNGPADVAQSTMIGRWAGARVLIQGDYAEDDDIPGWTGPALSDLYGAVGNTPDYKHYDPKVPSFTDISDDLLALIEGVCSVRFCGTGWLTTVPVKQIAVAGAGGIGEYRLTDDAAKDADFLSYLERAGVTEEMWKRVPRSGDWHGLRDNEVDLGQTRVIVNLDTLEYLDPTTFGEVPTIGGMMRGEFGGTASALALFLFHAGRRGGGDLPTEGDRDRIRWPKRKGYLAPIGRWRGGRILGTSEYRSDLADQVPTTEEVKAKGTNVSEIAMEYLTAIKDW